MMNDRNPVNPEGTGSEPILPLSGLQYARPTGTRKPSVADWILAVFGLIGAIPFVFLGAVILYEIYDEGLLDDDAPVMGLSSLFGFAVGGLGVWNAVRIVRRRKLPPQPE